MLEELIPKCYLDNIYLTTLSKSFFLQKKTLKKEENWRNSNLSKEAKKNIEEIKKGNYSKEILISDAYPEGTQTNIIGYLTLDKNNYLTIVIAEEYQNRGIATAMIAKFLEIYSHRHFTNNKIYMVKKSIFIEKIANKLKFVLNNDVYERHSRINDPIITQVNNHKLLTYSFNKEYNGFDSEILIKELNMVQTKSQFVHLAYSEVGSGALASVTKSSTGSKYLKNFIIQGSELKSVLSIKNMQIDIYKEYADNISQYKNYTLYLHNEHRIHIHVFFFLYMSKNGIKKCYYMNDNWATCSDIPFKDELKDNPIFIKNSDIQNGDIKYKWPNSFKDDNIDIKSFDPYIEKIADSIINSNSSIYSESNSGFTIINATINFMKKNQSDKYEPQIKNLYTNISISGFDDKTYQNTFSKEYYNFLIKNIINPHFGISTEMPDIPMRCIIDTELNDISTDIISKLFLKFDKNRTKVEIYLDGAESQSSIGYINLNIDNISEIVLTHIELLPQYRKKNIAVNVLFVLMEILASYYAPLNISLKMAFVKQMHNIAYALKFHKTLFTKRRQKENSDLPISEVHSKYPEEYYIRLCRI